MAGKFSFRIASAVARRDFPDRLIIGQHDHEPPADVILKALAYLLFFRPRLHIDLALHNDSIPYRPDVVELDYELRPVLWIECGEVSVRQLDKLAVKVPEAEIAVVQSSAEAEALVKSMRKAELRQNRYRVLALATEMVSEMCGRLRPRNDLFWVKGSCEPAELQFDFNGLWFEGEFEILRV